MGNTTVDNNVRLCYHFNSAEKLSAHFLNLAFFKGNIMANSNQTFKVAGITIHNGNAKVRFTDDMVRRIKQFTKGGASRVDFVELPSEMTKVEALKSADWYDKSDAMTDYFNTAYYVDVNIGKWDKPYSLEK